MRAPEHPRADAQRADQGRGHHPHIMSLPPCPARDPEGFRACLQNDAPWRSFPQVSSELASPPAIFLNNLADAVANAHLVRSC